MKKFSGNQIKLFMALLMVFDHLYYIPGLLSNEFVGFFHVITRCVSVWFAYMVVEGFKYTSNRIKYNVRLFIWAATMDIGNILISNMLSLKEIHIHNNIFTTLAFSVLILNLISDFKDSTYNKKILKVVGVILTVSLMFLILPEGFLIIIPFVVVTYLTDKRHSARYISYALISVFLLITSYVSYGDYKTTLQMLAYNSDFMFITVIPFMLLYNGERGKKTKISKYFFYIFYPLHLWLLAMIAYIVK